jgi:hypothetical protein
MADFVLGDLNAPAPEVPAAEVPPGGVIVTGEPVPIGLPEPTEIPEYSVLVVQQLVQVFRRGYNTWFNNGVQASDGDITQFINTTLNENEALVSGGFVLRCIHNEYPVGTVDVRDIDIYVPCKNLSRFNKIMSKLMDAREVRQHTAAFYCRSFLRKNKIRSVQTFVKPGTRRRPNIPSMDIMGVRKSSSPINVVRNFDLTFCQVWFDGNSTYATHPEHVRTKRGVLQKDYVEMLLRGNKFILNRIKKYTLRGYVIEVENTIVPGDIEHCKRDIHRDDPDHYRKWLSRLVFHTILFHKYRITSNYRAPLNILHNDFHVIDNASDQPIDITDGYDSEDYDITSKETYYPLIEREGSWFVPDAHKDEWNGLSIETKFWHTVFYCMQQFYI